MNARKLPDRFPLDKEDGEKLNSDFRKQAEFTGKFTAGLVGGLAVLGAIISFFDKNKQPFLFPKDAIYYWSKYILNI